MLDILVMVLGTLCCCVGTLFRGRSNMLILNLCAIILFIFYWLHQNEPAAVSLTIAGLVSSSIQFLTPQKYLAGTMLARLGIALGTAFIGFAMHFQNMHDLIPLLGFTAARLGEVSAHSTHIRFGYIFSTCCWFVFSVVIADPITIATNGVMLAVQSYAALRDMNLVPHASRGLNLGLKLVPIKRSL